MHARLFSAGKFMLHGYDLWKNMEFLCTVPQKFGSVYVEKWIQRH
jgi:hypothetical protein